MPIAASQAARSPARRAVWRRGCNRAPSAGSVAGSRASGCASVRASASAASCPVITMSLVAWATSAAEPTATATSAPASIGASFTPSPTTTTRAPAARSDASHASLSAGDWRAAQALMPSARSHRCDLRLRVTTRDRHREPVASERIDRGARARPQALVDVECSDRAVVVGEDHGIVEVGREAPRASSA